MKKIVLFLFLFINGLNCIAQKQYTLNRNTVEVHVGIGRRALINSRQGVFRGTASLNYNWRIHKYWDIKTGLDVIYWNTVYKGLPNDPGYLLRSTSYEHFAYALFVGGDFKMDRVTFQTGVGYYLYFKTLDLWNVKYYTKIGLRYQLTKHLSTGFFLRAHANEADYMDFGIGYKF